MIFIKPLVFIFIYIYSSSIFAINIAVVNIELIINENQSYINFLNEIDQNQKKYLEKFKKYEEELDKLLKEIEDSKLLLSEGEINTMISNYNNELNQFTKLVDKFNLHYQNEILKIRKIILDEIIVLLEKYAKNNNIELVLDATSYLLASNSINLTSKLKEELDNTKLNLEFEDFENN